MHYQLPWQIKELNKTKPILSEMYYPITEKYIKEYIQKYTEKQNCALNNVSWYNKCKQRFKRKLSKGNQKLVETSY